MSTVSAQTTLSTDSTLATNTPFASTPAIDKEQSLILWLGQVGMADVGIVGGKNASLGEMITQLTPLGINVPTGFATTAHAYRLFLQETGLEAKLQALFADLDVTDIGNLQARGRQARTLILGAPFPVALTSAINAAYAYLCQHCGHLGQACSYTPFLGDAPSHGPEVDVAVRSSATAEDLPDASFAGQQETFLNITGARAVLDACHRCFASLFTDRAIAYRVHKGFDHFQVALSVGVQKMVRSDLAGAGVMFSIDPETGFKNAALISAAYGLGENVVQGAVNPDEYLVFKPTLKQGFQPIISKHLGSKEMKMVYDTGGTHLTKNMAVSAAERQAYVLDDSEILQLAHWACLIEDHYSQLRGVYTPMDIEWAKDGHTGELFIVQARPETVQSQKQNTLLQTYQLQPNQTQSEQPPERPEILVCGQAVGEMIGQGPARVIAAANRISEFLPGEVLVTNRTDPDWEPIMKQASAIVTNQGGRTCHAAIIARELGIPAIVGCGNATTAIQTGQAVTVSCAEGEEGHVYAGLIPFHIQATNLENLPSTRTQILMNVGNPQEALRLAAIPCHGVGLARLEFIIANQIQAHPLALLHYDQLTDEMVKRQIDQLTAQYPYKPDFFVAQLAQGVGRIAAAFYPYPVIVRLSDFKSNEYANLLGGKQFEPEEENPMLGWRGASRYYDPNYAAAFGLECQAIKQVREQMGLTNLIPMVPFCRTPAEGRQVLAEMAKYGLVRGENGLEVYVMCEIPNNVILADQFSQIFDGFSIGSNDLTQLTLGLDRDSALVAHIFDERDEGVKELIRQLIAKAKQSGRKVGICGQAPSDYPEFAKFLVELGIDSISLNPDSVLKTMLLVAETEAALSH